MTFSKGLVAASVAVVTALSAGCASSASLAGPGPGSAQPSQPSMSVPTSDPPYIPGPCPASATDPAIARLRAASDGVALPKDFHAVAVVRCVSVERSVPGDGTWEYAVAQRADTGLNGLISALRLPSQSQPAGTAYACPAMGMAVPTLGLVDASGNVVRPRLPHAVCGFPLPAVLGAMAALPWRTEAEQKLTRLTPPPVDGISCPPEYKDLFGMRDVDVPPTTQDRTATTTPMYACVYDIAPNDGPAPIGRLGGTVKFSTSQQSAILGALEGAGRAAAPACALTATRVAVIAQSAPDPGDTTVDSAVELDGCRRLRFPDGVDGVAPAQLIRTLTPLANTR